jgi:hypothetical protein
MKYFYLLLLLPALCAGQGQNEKLLLYNVGFGAITSTIGAVINKPKHSSWKQVALKSLWQGSIGGLLHYTGKKGLYLINKHQSLGYAWPAKLVHNAGSCIIENAALNQPFLQNWNIDVGPVRFDFSLNGKKSFTARFLPWSINCIIAGASDGRFDARTSLLTGNITFKSDDALPGNNMGFSYGRSIVYLDGTYETLAVIAHELVHQFQYNDYMVFNTWLTPLQSTIKSERLKTIFKKYIYLDLPWFLPFYALEGEHGHFHYYRNFFEFEAQRFATNRYVPIP